MSASTAASLVLPASAPTRPWRRRVLAALGLALLAAAAVTAWRHATLPAPYRYVEPAAAQPPAPTRVVQVLAADGERPIAEAEVATDGNAPVLLGWRAKIDEPILYLPAPADEAQALAAVIARHREPGVPLLAWWDSSRQLRHFGAGDVFFDQHLRIPLFVPPAWQGQRARIDRTEAAFWHDAATPAQRSAFATFARALVAPEAEGVRQLRSLVPAGKAIVVLHLRDLLLLGQMFPQQLGVAFQDFADTGDVHRSVRGVQGWLQQDEHAAYSVIKLAGNQVRALALRDEASAETLAARLLPLIGNRQEDVAGMTLVFRSGGFSVFELGAADSPAPK